MTARGSGSSETTMTLITLRNLGVTLGAPLFSDLSFSLVVGDRLGLPWNSLAQDLVNIIYVYQLVMF